MALPEQLKNLSILELTIQLFNRNIGKLNLHHIGDRVLLNTPRLKIKRHAQDIGHAQSTQPNTPMYIYTGYMEHAQRTPLSEHPHRTYIRH